jgi:hypothetical protein
MSAPAHPVSDEQNDIMEHLVVVALLGLWLCWLQADCDTAKDLATEESWLFANLLST